MGAIAGAPDGIPAPSDPAAAFDASVVSGISVFFGSFPSANFYAAFGTQPTGWVSSRPAFLGRAPELIGVDQLNVQVPDGVTEGCTVPITVGPSSSLSQPVPISIRRGGGPCVDAPKASYGQLIWERTADEAQESGHIGRFEAQVAIPPPIEITTPLPPGIRIANSSPGLMIKWKNGRPDAVGEVRLITHKTVDLHPYARCRVLASEGQLTMEPALWPTGRPPYSMGLMTRPAELVVIVTPLTSAQQTFSAPGLTRDSHHTWRYEYHFSGLEII